MDWLDVLDVMGPGVAPAARRLYVSQIQHTPWMYEFFFSRMWRHRWYRDAARLGIGSWRGRAMGPYIRSFRPDVVVSTYPMGSAGLSWLRRRGQLPMPAGAWVPAFCPHPFWLYGNLDITYVMHPRAAALAKRTEPGARVAVGALPVVDAFTPGDQAAARPRLGVPPGRFTVAVCSGSLGFGAVERAVCALLAAGPDVQVIAMCRNERLGAGSAPVPGPAAGSWCSAGPMTCLDGCRHPMWSWRTLAAPPGWRRWPAAAR